MIKTFLLGMKAAIYFGEAVPPDEAVNLDPALMTVMGNATDVTLNMEAGEADITTRANNGWRATAPTLRECSVEFEMVWKPGDPGFDAIKTAFLTSSEVALAVLSEKYDVDNSTGEGPVGNFTITNFSRSEPLEEAIKANVTAKLAAFGRWYKAA